MLINLTDNLFCLIYHSYKIELKKYVKQKSEYIIGTHIPNKIVSSSKDTNIYINALLSKAFILKISTTVFNLNIFTLPTIKVDE